MGLGQGGVARAQGAGGAFLVCESAFQRDSAGLARCGAGVGSDVEEGRVLRILSLFSGLKSVVSMGQSECLSPAALQGSCRRCSQT